VRMSSQARIDANGGCGTLVAERPGALAGLPGTHGLLRLSGATQEPNTRVSKREVLPRASEG
jgi:hypothetical protein